MVNKEFIVAGIKNLLKRNYGINPQTVDIDALVDSTLSFSENWFIIKDMISCEGFYFDYLRCENCNKRIKADWIYCPYCSKEVQGERC